MQTISTIPMVLILHIGSYKNLVQEGPHRLPAPRTNRSELVRDFQNFYRSWSGPRFQIFSTSQYFYNYFFFKIGPNQDRTARSETNRFWSVDPWAQDRLTNWSRRLKNQIQTMNCLDDVCYLVSKPIAGKTLELVLKIT